MRILYVKTSSLGDVIHHCPAVNDVRVRLPGASIDWVVEEQFAQIVAMLPAVRRVLPVAIRRWRTRLFSPAVWGQMLAFRRELRSQRYDFVIDSQGLLKSALIAAAARGAKHGFDAASAREPLASRFYDFGHPVKRELHAVERNRELTAAALGVDHGGACEYGIAPPAGNPLVLSEPFCVLLSMSSRADKLWPEERWPELVRALAARGWESVLPWGSEAEHARCLRISAASGTGLVPRALSLVEMASLMKCAHAVVGVDTGLAHLATALGVPTVGLYCSTHAALTGLYGGARAVNLGGPGSAPSAASALAALERLV